MFYLLLDTSEYRGQGFDFSNKSFLSLKELIENGQIQLYTSPIIIGEVQTQLEESESSIMREFNTILERIEKNIPPYRVYTTDIKKSHKFERQLVMDYFQKLLTDLDTIEIPIDCVLVSELFELYFEGTAPFSGKKKYEFPDAAIILSIKKFLETQYEIEELFIISRDDDWNTSLSVIPKIQIFKSLQKCLDYINRQIEAEKSDIIKKIESYVNLPDFKEKFSEKVECLINDDLSIFVVADEEEVDNPTISEMRISNIQDLEFINIGTEEITVSLTFDIQVELYVEVYDYAHSPWDKEDKRYLWTEKRNGNIHFEEEQVYCEVIFAKDEVKNYIFGSLDYLNFFIDKINNEKSFDIVFNCEFS